MNNLGGNLKRGFIWSFLGHFGYLLLTFLTNLVLARLLTPNEFGIIAIISFFIAISKILSESGLSGALIRKKDSNEIDNSTIFIFNLSISIFIYIILFIISPLIEDFYKITNLSLYLRVIGIVMIINSFQIIQNVRLIKKLEYKKISLYTTISLLFASFISISLAFLGYGIWSLILLQILNALFLTLIYWIKEDGLKVFIFSKKSFKELYSFGFFTTISSLLNTGFDNLYQLILSKYFGLNQAGFYFQAKKLAEIPVGVIRSTTLGVVFSALSNIQDDEKNFNSFYNEIVRIFTVIVGFICLFIFLYSKDIILIIYGEKWLDSVFYMKILALSSFFYMQEMFNRILFKVFNETKKIFHLEIVKKSINLIFIISGIYFKNIFVLMYGFFITSVISYFINYYYSRKIYTTNFSYKELIYSLKVAFVMILLISLSSIFNFIYVDNYIFKSLFLLLLISLYLLLLYLFKVFNLKRDFIKLKNLKTDKN